MNKRTANLILATSLMLGSIFLPAYSQEIDDESLTPEQREKINFVSKYDVNLNSDKDYLFDIPNAAISLTFDSGNKTLILINDALIDSSKVGKTQTDKKINKTTVTYYGISLNEGKNTVKAIISNSNGAVIQTLNKDVFVKGKPDKLTIEKTRIPADAKTVGKVIIDVRDKWNNPVIDGTFVTLKFEHGEIKSEDANPNVQGLQVVTKNGKAEVLVQSGSRVDTYKIEALAGDITGSGTIDFTPPLRAPVFVAIAKNRTNYSFVNGNTFSSDPKGQSGFGNIFGVSGFSQGTLFDDYLLTFAFNSQKRLNALEDDQNILLRDRAEDRTYPIYGDSSQLNQIAVANSNVFFKLEKDKSSLLWGDYTTGANSINSQMPMLSNYNRVLTGAKLNLNLPGITNIDVFGAMSNQVLNQDKIRGGGVSGPYYTSKYPLVSGTERIMLQTEKRDLSGTIVDTKTLNRLSDYNIDYANGTITFSQPVPSFDKDLNPIYIVINYDYYPNFINTASPSVPNSIGALDNSLNNMLVGARIHQPLNVLGTYVGGTYIREFSSANPYQLFGANIGSKIGENFDFIAEYANSNGTLIDQVKNTSSAATGSSYRAALNYKPFDNLMFNGEYQFIEATFLNRTGSSFTPGSERYNFKGTYRPFTSTDLSLEYNRNNIFSSNQLLQTANAIIRQDIFSHNVSLGVEGRNFPDPKDNTKFLNAGLLNLTYKSPTFYNISLNASREQNFLGDVDQLRPTMTTIGADYAITNNIKLFAKQSFLEREKLVTATAVGVDTGFTRESNFLNSVNVGAKYQIDGSLDGRSGQTRIGLNNKLNVLPELSLGLNYERVMGESKAQVLNFGDTDYNAYSLSAEYTPKDLGLRLSGKYDLRDGTRGSQLYNLNAAGAVGDDFSLFGRFNHNISNELSRRGNTEGLFGLAYRPLGHDYFNGLLKYQIKRTNMGINQLSDVLSNTFSFEGFIQPSYSWELYTKLALRNSIDSTEGFNPVNSNISLGLARLTHKFMYNFDGVLEYRNLGQWETKTNYNEISAEIGYFPIKDLRLGLGYNFLMYSDAEKRENFKDILGSNYTSQGPYINLTMKLDSLGSWWGQQGVFSKKDMKAEEGIVNNDKKEENKKAELLTNVVPPINNSSTIK